MCSLDNYYKDHGHMSNEQIAELNFDDPDEIDWELMLSDVFRMLENQPFEMPVYNLGTHRRERFMQTMRAAEFVIVEGLFVLHRQELVEKAIAKIFVNCDEYVRIGRRIKRDVTERGRTESEILERYLNTTEPMHREIVEPTMANADLIVCGCGDREAALMTVQDYLLGKPHFREQLADKVSPLQCWI
jgi:uridine kinase